MPNVTSISPTDFTLQFYETQDENLISQFEVDTVLTGSSYIEFYIYDNNQTLLNSTTNYNSYNVLNDGQAAQSSEIMMANQQEIIIQYLNSQSPQVMMLKI